MTQSLGSLVVSLALDTADFIKGFSQADLSIKRLEESTLRSQRAIDRQVKSFEQSAFALGKSTREIALLDLANQGATKSQLASANAALKMSEAHELNQKLIAGTRAALVAMSVAAIGGVLAFDGLVKSAAKFKDIEERTGGSAEGFASLTTAAAAAGTPMEAIDAAVVRLTKSLTGIDDESKEAGAALKALGLPIEDFKKLDPVAQYEAVGKALNGFEDGAGKTAVALALFGKSGAEQLKVFKALEEQGGRHVTLTQDQIEAADRYADAQAVAAAKLQGFLQVVAIEALPALTAFTETMGVAVKSMLGLNESSTQLQQNAAVREFAEGAARVLATLIDYAVTTFKTIQILGKSFAALAADIELAAKAVYSFVSVGNPVNMRDALEKRNAIVRAYNEDLKAYLNTNTSAVRDALEKNFAAAREAAGAKLPKPPTPPKPVLQFEGAKKPDAGSLTAKDIAQFELSKIKTQLDGLTAAYKDAESILEATRSAGLADERDYYEAKRAFIRLAEEQQLKALQAENTMLASSRGTAKEMLDFKKRMFENDAKMSQLRNTAAAQTELLAIQQSESAKKVGQAYRDAEDAAQSYLDNLIRTQQRALNGFGMGDQARERTAGRAAIEDDFEKQRRDLAKSRRDAELNGTFGTDAQRKYDEELDRIRRFQAAALGEFERYYEQRRRHELSFEDGAAEALRNYLDTANQVAKQTEDAFTNAFKGLEDMLTGFITKGKLDFKGFADSVIADLARIIIKQQITAPLANLVLGQQGTSGNNPSAFTAGGGFFGNLLSSLFGGGRALGGPVAGGHLYEVNERRPELLETGGRQYLMMGGKPGTVKPQSSAGTVTHNHINLSMTAAPGMSQATAMQQGEAYGRGLQRALARNG